jgi:hypothetical protein
VLSQGPLGLVPVNPWKGVVVRGSNLIWTIVGILLIIALIIWIF